MHHISACQHLGHGRIITYTKRPYANTQEMDTAIITNARKVVKPNHDLWIVGDFALNEDSARAFMAHVPGRKHLVPGNHDDQPWVKTLGWTSIRDSIHELRDQGRTYLLCHYPMRSWPKMHRGAINLFSHVHDKHPGWNNSVNVGVDWWDFTPTTTKAILERAATLAPPPDWGAFTPPAHHLR